MLDSAERRYLFWNESEKLLCGSEWVGGRAVQFNIRKFPQMRIHNAFGPWADEEFASIPNPNAAKRRAVRQVVCRGGKFTDAIVLKGEAVFEIGQSKHLGSRGVQISAPSSIRID